MNDTETCLTKQACTRTHTHTLEIMIKSEDVVSVFMTLPVLKHKKRTFKIKSTGHQIQHFN